MKYVEYVVTDRIGYITLNRPEKRNALSYELVAALKDAFLQAADDEAVKVVVLRAHGESFCAGADLAYLQQLQHFSYEENVADSTHLKDLFQLIYTLKKVVIAEVQGHALAGGCGLASVCDFAFAANEAKFGFTEVKIGFVPAIVMVFLVRKLGEGRARQLLLTGDLVSAEEASRLGMIYAVTTRAALATDVQAFAQKLITTNAQQSMALTKQMLAAVSSMSLDDALTYAAATNAQARATEECRRGIAAFLNKEKIAW